MTLNVATAGTYDIKISTKLLNTRGVYQLAINGANVGALQDEYNATGSGIFATTRVKRRQRPYDLEPVVAVARPLVHLGSSSFTQTWSGRASAAPFRISLASGRCP